MQKYFCRSLTRCLLCNRIDHFDLCTSCIRLTHASSAVHWPFRQQTWGHSYSFLPLRNLSYKQSREKWSSHWTENWSQLGSSRPGCRAAGLLSFVSCSKEHRAWKRSPGPATARPHQADWTAQPEDSSSRARVSQPQIIAADLHSTDLLQNMVCSAR